MDLNYIKSGVKFSLVVLMLVAVSLNAQTYGVGETLRQETLDAILPICANGSGSTSLRDILDQSNDPPVRAVLINFFSSW